MKLPETLWEHLLELKECADRGTVKTVGLYYNKKRGFITTPHGMSNGGNVVRLMGSFGSIKSDAIVELLSGKLYLEVLDPREANIVECLKIYTPLALAKVFSDHSPFVMVHVAQSIDGKIATEAGSSKWIGNRENLVHAHRLRALADGILVGGNTVMRDAPSLNVRHVKGNDPIRIVWSNEPEKLKKLKHIPNGRTFLVKDISNSFPRPAIEGIHTCINYQKNSDIDTVDQILLELKKNNIHSLIIEGGSRTISSFLKNNAIHWMQFHISPYLFGSGISCISTPTIHEVQEGKKLNNIIFTRVGDAVMITGELEKHHVL